MANFGNQLGSLGSSIGNTIADAASSTVNRIGNAINDPGANATQPSVPSADGNGLPYTKVNYNITGTKLKRNIITWLVPEVGTIQMYINPNNITYAYKKIINKEKTKGGFTLQYWGEELPTLSIRGTTGSSGVEGINMLYEIYRAEQYTFDGQALSLAANNAANDLVTNGFNKLGNSIGGFGNALFGDGSQDGGAGLVGSILGLDSPKTASIANRITTLAQLAFTVEMYYDGWVFRGYFDNMNVTESADNFNYQYDMTFVVTQRRGYRTNYFPWHRTPKEGYSKDNTPHSFGKKV